METEPGKTARANWSLWVRAGVSMGLLVFLFWQVDWKDFISGLREIAPPWLLIIPVLFFLNTAVSSMKWQRILNGFGVQGSFGWLFKIYLISSFFSTFLPSTIGGDGYRFFALRSRYPGSGSEVASSIILDRAYGLLVLLIFHLATAAFYWQRIASYPILFWTEVGLVLGAGMGFFAFVALWRVREKVLAFLQPGRIRRWIEKGFEVIGLLGKPSARTILISGLLSLVFVLSSNTAWVIYYRAAGISHEWGFISYAATLSSLIAILPISINGIGLMELAQVAVIGILGISRATILLVSLISRVVTALLTASGGIAYLWTSLGAGEKPA